MPEISRFFGIRIFMYYQEHEPPHFHARYSGHRAVVNIESLKVVAGDLPERAVGLVLEWAKLHRSELLLDWARARDAQPLLRIDPLG